MNEISTEVSVSFDATVGNSATMDESFNLADSELFETYFADFGATLRSNKFGF